MNRLTILGTLVLAVEPAINDTHGLWDSPSFDRARHVAEETVKSGRAVRAFRHQEDLRTRRYHSHSSRTCFSV
jgi:hypothetical protein